MSFIDGIKERAKKDIKTIVLPEAEDERTIRAAAEVLSKKIAKLILLGNPDKIYAMQRNTVCTSVMRPLWILRIAERSWTSIPISCMSSARRRE